MNWQRIEQEWSNYLDTIIIKAIIKKFNFNCELMFVKKEWYGGSQMWVYRFIDPQGIEWSYDLNSRMYWEMVCNDPSALNKFDFMRLRFPKTTIRYVNSETKEMTKKQAVAYIKRSFNFESRDKRDKFIRAVMELRGA